MEINGLFLVFSVIIIVMTLCIQLNTSIMINCFFFIVLINTYKINFVKNK